MLRVVLILLPAVAAVVLLVRRALRKPGSAEERQRRWEADHQGESIPWGRLVDGGR